MALKDDIIEKRWLHVVKDTASCSLEVVSDDNLILWSFLNTKRKNKAGYRLLNKVKAVAERCNMNILLSASPYDKYRQPRTHTLLGLVNYYKRNGFRVVNYNKKGEINMIYNLKNK